MQKLMKHLHKSEKGFTLVELMVVVVIIGILVAIAVPLYNNVTANAQLRACQANLRTIDSAIAQNSAASTPLTLTNDAAGVGQLTTAGYLMSTPTCPSTNPAGVYTISNAGGAQRAACPNGHTYP